MGKYISFADAVLVAWVCSIGEMFGKESAEWMDVLSWQDGWWARYLQF